MNYSLRRMYRSIASDTISFPRRLTHDQRRDYIAHQLRLIEDNKLYNRIIDWFRKKFTTDHGKLTRLNYWLVARNNTDDVRAAVRWDGYSKSLYLLQRFVGHVPLRYSAGDGSVMVSGYHSVLLKAGMYIYDDSDGYAIGTLAEITERFHLYKSAVVRKPV